MGGSDVPFVRRERRCAGGFSLVELLVVVVIIAILAALLYPVVNTAQERGKMATCLSNLRQWAAFWNLYAADHGGNFSDGITLDEEDISTYARGEWAIALKDYYWNRSEILICPKARTRFYLPGKDKPEGYGATFHTYVQGTLPGEGRVAIDSSYGINNWVYNPPAWYKTTNTQTGVVRLHYFEVQSRPVAWHWRNMGVGSASGGVPRERIPLMLDSKWRGGGPTHNDAHFDRPKVKIYGVTFKNEALDSFSEPKVNKINWSDAKIRPPNIPDEYVIKADGKVGAAGYEMIHFAMDRHRGGIQACFLDGSARHVPIKELWRLKWHREYEMDYDLSKDFTMWPDWMKEYPEAPEID